jgi:hypothetical protein
MAIYLDEQTGPMLKALLKREIKRLPSNFVAERLLKMVESDEERKATIDSCEHDWNPMTGHKTQCNKCGGLLDGFEEWTSDSFLRERGADNPPSSQDDSAIPHSTPTHPDASKLL